ncbi:MAG TPA: EAL domain-containing protein [Acidimicrobiales bacterium]|nr:EAL domain-containing protein [Acidimicrobiales bacterium]
MTPPLDTPPNPRTPPLRLLVVEDDPAAADLMSALLEPVGEVMTATSMRSAFEAIAVNAPDCVLLDLGLPDAEGVDVVAAVVARHPEVPVLVVTGSDDHDTAAAAIGVGAQDVMVKGSFDGAVLRRRVRLAIERKRFDRTFFRGDQGHRRILDNAPVGVWRGDVLGLTTYTNRHLLTLLGRTDRTATIGVPLTLLLGGSPSAGLGALLAEAADRGSAHGVIGARRTGGASVPLRLRVSTMLDDGAGLREFVAIVEEASAAEASSGAALAPAPIGAVDAIRGVMATTSDAVAILDATGVIVAWNEAASRMWHIDASEAIGRNVFEIIPEEEREVARARHRAALDGEAVEFEVVRRRANGSTAHVAMSARPVPGVSGRLQNVVVTARDLTELREAVQARHRSELLLSTVVSVAPMVLCVIDSTGRIVYADGRALEALGAEPADVVGASIFECFGDDETGIVNDIHRGLAGEHVASVRQRDDTSWDVRFTPMIDAGGTVTGVVGVGMEITERLASESRFSAVVEHVTDIISIHRTDGSISWASPAATRVLGLRSGIDLSGFRVDPHIHPDDRQFVDAAFESWRRGLGAVTSYRLFDATGAVRHMESVGVDLRDHPAINGIVVTTRDVTDRRIAEERLARAALHDPLTDLPNRTLLIDRLDHALATRRRDGKPLAVVFVDLDHFKLVNDALGYSVGDALVQAAADVLRLETRPGDTIARLSGDEFAICLPGLASEDDALAAAARILRALNGQRIVHGHQVHVSATAGVAIADDHSVPEQLLADAEVAMYRGKERGRSRVELFDSEARARVVGRLALQNEIRTALERGEFRLFYQPQIRLESREIVGVEALIRWEHPTRGLLSPAAFIDIAEESHLIEPIGQWVIEEACRQLGEWRKQFPERRLVVSVNLSARQLSNNALPEMVLAAIRAAGIPPASLCLEITESMLMEDAEGAVAILRRLKETGVQIALDDFGTGYSSLAYLKRFPLEQLKVDRSFVAGLGRDPEDFVIVSAVVNLARSLGVEVVAEGVENERHVAELETIGCELAQGYLWSPPIPPSSIAPMLAKGALVGSPRPVAPADRVAARASQAIDVVSLITHELRAPLTVIKGYAETMSAHLGDATSPVVAKATAAITRNVSNLDDLIATLSDVNALEAGTLPLRRKTVDLTELVHGIVADHRHLFPDHEVRVTATSDAINVHVDPSRVQQILLNLLTNAAKFSPPEKGIEVGIVTSGSDVLVSVVDHGPGVQPELIGEIFRKFFRADTSKKGTGLGLYIARSLARAHGGELSCRAAAGGGAEFVLTLPRSIQRRAAPGAGGTSVITAPRAYAMQRPDAALCERAELPAVAQAAIAAAQNAVREAIVVEQVVAATIALARSLGGGCIPARSANAMALSHEISFGAGEPLLVTAPPGSLARTVLDNVLPEFVDEAARAVDAIDDALVDDTKVDPVTGFLGRRAAARAIARQPIGATLALMRLEGAPADVDDALRALGRTLREVLPEDAAVGRFGDDQLVVMLSRGDSAAVKAMIDEVERRWSIRHPEGATIAAGVATVGAAGTQAALLTADERSLQPRLEVAPADDLEVSRRP